MYLGIDLGTSSIKCLLIDDNQKEIVDGFLKLNETLIEVISNSDQTIEKVEKETMSTLIILAIFIPLAVFVTIIVIIIYKII